MVYWSLLPDLSHTLSSYPDPRILCSSCLVGVKHSLTVRRFVASVDIFALAALAMLVLESAMSFGLDRTTQVLVVIESWARSIMDGHAFENPPLRTRLIKRANCAVRIVASMKAEDLVPNGPVQVVLSHSGQNIYVLQPTSLAWTSPFVHISTSDRCLSVPNELALRSVEQIWDVIDLGNDIINDSQIVAPYLSSAGNVS